jgi:RHS repeat-associated protein
MADVPATGSALYYAEDTLGSSRVIVQSTGTLCYDADFTPFGAERSYTSTCAQNYKFEGKERDTETQNDDFGARYYSWRFGRWLSSDWSAVPVPVPYANLTNPQTLNLYAMVHDDPESFADLDGHVSAVLQQLEDQASSTACSQGVLSACESGAQQQQQNALVARINNFDHDVSSATDADMRRGSSADPVIDRYLHTSGLEEQTIRGMVQGREQDLQTKDLTSAIDHYVSHASPGELNRFEGRLDRIQRRRDKEISTARTVGNAVLWGLSKLPWVGATITVAKAITPSPAQVQLINHGKEAVEKQLDTFGDTP